MAKKLKSNRYWRKILSQEVVCILWENCSKGGNVNHSESLKKQIRRWYHWVCKSPSDRICWKKWKNNSSSRAEMGQLGATGQIWFTACFIKKMFLWSSHTHVVWGCFCIIATDLRALVVRNLPASAGDIRGTSSIPASGRSPGGGHGNPLQYSCLENPLDRGAWQANVHRVAKSPTWRLNAHTTELSRYKRLYGSQNLKYLLSALWHRKCVDPPCSRI